MTRAFTLADNVEATIFSLNPDLKTVFRTKNSRMDIDALLRTMGQPPLPVVKPSGDSVLHDSAVQVCTVHCTSSPDTPQGPLLTCGLSMQESSLPLQRLILGAFVQRISR